MKQKLLTLFALLVVAVTGAWADETLFSMEIVAPSDGKAVKTDTHTAGDTPTEYSLSDYATFGVSGTNAIFYKTKKQSGTAIEYISKPKDDNWVYGIAAGGDKAGYKITLSKAIAEGDIIDCVVFPNSTSKKTGLLFNTEISTTGVGASETYSETKVDKSLSYTVQEGDNIIGATTLYVTRADGTSTYFKSITIRRANSKTVTSRVLTGININGSAWNIAGLSGNAATINDEYAGPPTVQFVYTENYDDETSAAGKKEDVVAVKNGANYEATSTVLTTNVTLSFTNVSNVLFSMTNPTAPTEALASKASSAVTATFSPGGSAVVYNGHGSSASELVYAGEINLNGSSASYFQANFTAALAEGDVITSSNTNSNIFKVGNSNSNSSATTITFPYTIPSGSNLIGKKSVYVYKNSTPATFSSFTITRPKTIDTQEFGGVKKGETTLTETTDYTVSETTITLTDAHKATLVPTDVKLINHITYDDASTEDKDVDVTLAENGDFFEGTATIGVTTYTVKVPVDNTTPVLSLSAASGSISLNSYTPTGTAKVTVTGANLENGTFNAPTADGVTVTPATVEITDGTLSQEFTITSSATTAASTVLNFAYTGATTQTYTLSYTKTAKRDVTQTDVIAATTWDWSKAGSNTIELGESTSPTNAEEFLMATLPEVNNDANFNSQALKVVCQFPTRGSNNYFQGNSIKFNTTVPGTVQVWFSNTSNRSDNATNRRFLYVNGINSGVYTLNQTFTNIEATPVAAGEIIINAFTGDETPVATMVRINKIIFTPLSGDDVDVIKVTDVNYATYVTTDDIDFTKTDGVQAYKVTSAADAIEYEEVEAAPEGTPLLIKANSSSYVLKAADATPAAVTGNLLQASTGSTVGDGSTIYVLGKKDNNAVWGLLKSGNTLSAGKAYLEIAGGAKEFYDIIIGGDGETTGIESIHNSQFTIHTDAPMYNLSGQRVGENYKGIVIVNGKKYMNK